MAENKNFYLSRVMVNDIHRIEMIENENFLFQKIEFSYNLYISPVW